MARFVLGLVVVLGACGDDPITMPPERVPLCTATLAMSGTIAAPQAPDPTLGCQPAGTWTVSVQVADMGTCTAVNVPTTVTIAVTGTAHNETITHDKVSGEDDSLEINGDNDACNGNFELVIPDGSQFDQLLLQPHTGDFCPMKTTDANGVVTCGTGAITSTTITLNGDGEFDLWAQHP